MTEAQRFRDMLELGRRLRSRIHSIVDELQASPNEEGPVGPALGAWRVALLTLIWDISDAPLTLAATKAKQIRAARILNRALYEYAIHLEYYAYDHKQAVQDWMNSEAWLKQIVKAGTDLSDILRWTREERRAYSQMLKAEGKFTYMDVNVMVRKVLEGRQYKSKEVRRGVRHAGNFYAISSSFVHGSQGAFYDLFEQIDDAGTYQVRYRSFRLTEYGMLHETLFFMIQAIYAESIWRRRDLGAHMYWRELELISGLWEQVPRV